MEHLTSASARPKMPLKDAKVEEDWQKFEIVKVPKKKASDAYSRDG